MRTLHDPNGGDHHLTFAGGWLVGGRAGGVVGWDPAGGDRPAWADPLADADGRTDAAWQVRAGPCGRWLLAVAPVEDRVTVFDLAAGRRRRDLRPSRAYPPAGAVFATDGRRVLDVRFESRIRLGGWSVGDWQPIPGHDLGDAETGLAGVACPDGYELVVAVRVDYFNYRLLKVGADGAVTRHADRRRRLHGLAPSAGGGAVFAVGPDGVRRIATDTLEATAECPLWGVAEHGLAATPDGRRLLVAAGRQVHTLDARTLAACGPPLDVADDLGAVAVAPDGLTAAVATGRGTVVVFDLD